MGNLCGKPKKKKKFSAHSANSSSSSSSSGGKAKRPNQNLSRRKPPVVPLSQQKRYGNQPQQKGHRHQSKWCSCTKRKKKQTFLESLRRASDDEGSDKACKTSTASRPQVINKAPPPQVINKTPPPQNQNPPGNKPQGSTATIITISRAPPQSQSQPTPIKNQSPSPLPVKNPQYLSPVPYNKNQKTSSAHSTSSVHSRTTIRKSQSSSQNSQTSGSGQASNKMNPKK